MIAPWSGSKAELLRGSGYLYLLIEIWLRTRSSIQGQRVLSLSATKEKCALTSEDSLMIPCGQWVVNGLLHSFWLWMEQCLKPAGMLVGSVDKVYGAVIAGRRAGNLWFWGELPASPCLSCLVTPLYTSRGNSLRGYSRPPTFRWEMYAICGFAPFHTVGNWFVFPLLQQSPSLFCSKQTLNSQRQMGKYSGSAQCISMPGLPCSFPASCLSPPVISEREYLKTTKKKQQRWG